MSSTGDLDTNDEQVNDAVLLISLIDDMGKEVLHGIGKRLTLRYQNPVYDLATVNPGITYWPMDLVDVGSQYYRWYEFNRVEQN